jgi:hypothetical protein
VISVTPDLALPLTWLVDALMRFAVRHEQLLALRAGETVLSARLAVHLASVVPDEWDVDAEYDREGASWVQKIRIPATSGGMARRMRPDVVVHVRGQRGPESNLLVVEMKRRWSGSGNAADLAKAQTAIGRIGYQYAVVLGMCEQEPRIDIAAECRFRPRWTVFTLGVDSQVARDPEQFGKAIRMIDNESIFDDGVLAMMRHAAVKEADARRARRDG